MKQPSKFKLTISALLVSLCIGTASANQPVGKQIIFIDFETQSQLKLLKNMDVLGVNLKQHWAEVSVNASELQQLQKHKLHIRMANYRLNEFFGSNDGYLNPTQVREALTTINTQYPHLTRLFETGRTHRNLPIMALEISVNPGDTDKPVVVFNGMHHAREVMTPEVILHIAKVLTEKYGQNAEVTHWLSQYRVVLVPQVNPDGNELVSRGNVMWRKNAYQLKNRTVGVDLNRNYPAYWNYCRGSDDNPSGETYRGPSPGSEPETKAMMHLVETLKPVVDISYHSYSELIIYPYGCGSIKNPAKDLFHSIGMSMRAGIRDDNNQTNTYALGTAPEVIYEADGSDLDWQWKEHGVFAYTIEVNSYGFRPDYEQWRDITVERQEGGWQALLERMSKSGFRAHIQTTDPDTIRYSLKKIEGTQKLAFDGDEPNRTFELRSSSGLMYQLTEKGRYEVTFYVLNQPVKTVTIEVGDEMVDLGTIEI